MKENTGRDKQFPNNNHGEECLNQIKNPAMRETFKKLNLIRIFIKYVW